MSESSWDFSFLLWTLFVTKSSVPLAKGLTPVIFRSFGDSLTIQWWKGEVIIFRKRKSHGHRESKR